MSYESNCHGEAAGLTSKEQVELTSARGQIRELEMEIDINRRASEIFKELNPHNRQRRHSKLGYLTPVEYERMHLESKQTA